MFTFQGPQLAPHKQIMQVIQAIPVSEEALRFLQERNILLILCFFQPQLGFLQAGRRSETIKADDTMSTITPVPLHGQGPSFREPQRHQQHRVLQVFPRSPLHRHLSSLHPLRSLLSTHPALREYMKLVPYQLGGRFAVLPVGDLFLSTTTQKLLPGATPG